MTTKRMRELIEVTDVTETEDVIIISYWRGKFKTGIPICELIVDRKENTELMMWVDGTVCQWDAINIVVHHELQALENKVIVDMGVTPKNVKDN